MQKWIDANPDYMEDQDKQKYFIDMVRHCGNDLNDMDIMKNVGIKISPSDAAIEILEIDTQII